MCCPKLINLGAITAILVVFAAKGFCNISTTAPAATRPVIAGRDTPAGAMNTLMQAIDRGDFATVADSWNLSQRRRNATAYKVISARRFYLALEAQFGTKAATYVCDECEIGVWPKTHFGPGDWEYPPNQPDVVFGKHRSGEFSPMMQKGVDGIWRIGRIVHLRPPRTQEAATRIAAMIAREQAKESAWKEKFDPVIAGVETKKYATPAEVIHALYPQGSPKAQQRAAAAQQKEHDAAEERRLMAAHFDPSTLKGAVGAFMQAERKNDVAGVAKFFYARDDLNGKFAKANAERIVSAQQFQDAVNRKITDQQTDVIGELLTPEDAPWWADVQEHPETATATGTFEGGQKILFRDVDGVWKEDLTSSVPPIQRAAAMERDNAAVKRITAEVLAGKIKTIAQVHDAMKDAHLGERSSP